MINLKSSFTLKNLFILCLAALALAGCQDPMSGGSHDGREGSFSISIGAGARQVLSWDASTDISSLVHTITLTDGPDADIKQENVKFGQTTNFTVASGRWNISVYAFHDGVLKAEGFAAVDIKPGPNGAIPIKMRAISVTGVTITPPALSLNVGGTAILTAKITPANAAVNRNVTWASSNDAVATVNNGTVSAISEGTATITVTTEDGAKKAYCVVTVYPFATDIPVTFIGVTADGTESQTTTQLTLTFDKAIIGLSAADISVSGVQGVTTGTLSGSGPTYTLPISGFTNGGDLSVSVLKTGYTISGSPRNVVIYYVDTAVTFDKLTADGTESQTTTQLTLTFDKAIIGLSAADISVSGVQGVTKGTLSGLGPTYTLPISGFTAGGNLSVSVEKSEYTISGSPKNVVIYYYVDTAVTFDSVTADGSASQTTTQLTLTFSQAITGLTAADISVSGVQGVTTGTLIGSGPTYTLPISGFPVGGTLSVAVSSPSGYNVSGSPKTATIYYYTAPTSVTFSGVTANGSPNQTTTQLSLTFSQTITGLTASNITLSGVSGVIKGTLSGSGSSYTLPISGFTSGGNLTVAVSSPSGYNVSGSTKNVVIYYVDIDVSFVSVTADGDASQKTTTQLTLTFSQAITGLTASDITLDGFSGVSKGSLSGSGPTYTLPISGFTSGGTLSVAVSSPSGYNVSGSKQNVLIYYYTPTSGGSTISGSTIVSELDVSYSSGVDHDKANNFGYYLDSSNVITKLSNDLDSAGVSIKDSKVSITLGTPNKASNSNPLSITAGVVSYYIGDFRTESGTYRLMCQKNSGEDVGLMYVSGDTEVKAANPADPNIILKKGWNFIIWGTSTYATYATQTLPDGYEWKVTSIQ